MGLRGSAGVLSALAAAFVLSSVAGCRSRPARHLPATVSLADLQARYGQARYSQDDEETLIRAFFEDMPGGFFLDVGAGDPIKESTTYYLEKHLGWHGIAVDALAEYAGRYQDLRPATQFFSYFVAEKSGPARDFFASSLPEFSSGTGDDPRGGKYEKRQVATITLNELLRGTGISHVDFLSLDIEGAEPLALAGFDIDRFRPALACVEVHSAEHGHALAEYFAVHGYREITAYRLIDPVNHYYARSP